MDDEGEPAAAMIGIRREDKSEWETRVPLVPDDVARLVRDHGVRIEVERSANRCFADDRFAAAGAELVDGPPEAPIVVGVKEIAREFFRPGRTYVFFSHTIKGQPYNMPMLRRLMELGCQLIDYELITDEKRRRLVFFGRHAGLAGMIDALWLFGCRLAEEGVESAFADIRPAHRYADLDDARTAIERLAGRLRAEGLPAACRPLVCGFAGYGHVSRGAQEIYDLLPVEEVAPSDLGSLPPAADACFKTVFREEDMVVPVDPSAGFGLQDYYDRPARYRSRFADYLPHLDILVNGIYWEARYPRLVTKAALRELYGGAERPRLRLIADITCDIEGAVECTVRATDPGNPAYVFEPATGRTVDGVAGEGPVVLAVDTLPCELPVDASIAFSGAFGPLVPALARADFAAPLAECGLPAELRRATILYQGKLTEPYRYLEEFL